MTNVGGVSNVNGAQYCPLCRNEFNSAAEFEELKVRLETQRLNAHSINARLWFT